ncbi:Dihydrofolate reductase [hydrothermal vent metagenome]|uniref:dihydrofolate reductase n=1 Tax=hydrothermal vent metagenome TaxID=652676 RepID=A0A3B1DHF8_9ZZZZ
MKNLNIIVAIDIERGIGKAGDMPWRLPGELKHFKEVTTQTSSDKKQNAVIMGRKTWESIPEKFRPLPNRLNIVLTRNQEYEVPEGVCSADSLEKALNVLESVELKDKVESIFVIGGQQVFEEALKYSQCQKLYITHIQKNFSCDTFFPPFENSFERESFSSCHNENSCTYYFTEYMKKI